jgi:hypothetical protein
MHRIGHNCIPHIMHLICAVALLQPLAQRIRMVCACGTCS